MEGPYAVPAGSECHVGELVHPRVEPEIAFVTKAELRPRLPHRRVLVTDNTSRRRAS